MSELFTGSTDDDVAVLANTCNAVRMAQTQNRPEIFGAIVDELVASLNLDSCFTQAFIAELSELNGAVITFATLAEQN